MIRAYSINEVCGMKREAFNFSEAWDDFLGEAEKSGIWFIWGNSGNGKSSLVMQLCKELIEQGLRGVYYSLEEGTAKTFQNNLQRNNMLEYNKKMQIVDGGNMADLDERMLMKRAPDFAIVDSFQYTQLSYKKYIEFKERHKAKKRLIIFTSHADGKQPSGRSAKSVMYDAALKIWVEGHVAFSKGRFIGDVGKYIIWDKGAYQYWNIEDIMDLNTSA